MFGVPTIPELARESRMRELTPAEIDEIYGAGPPPKDHDCAPTQTCDTVNGCQDDGDDSDWC